MEDPVEYSCGYKDAKLGEKVEFRANGVWNRGEVTKIHKRDFGLVSYSIIGDDGLEYAMSSEWVKQIPYGVSYVADKPDTDEPENVRWFRRITERMAQTYKAKNSDYGDSFGKSIEKYGAIAGLTRISDKFNRLENLLLNGCNVRVGNESIYDTLLDLSNYSIMLYMALKNNEGELNLENKEN